MEKVYRLLRNNLEKGPYLIDELLHQNIQFSDFIWVEGTSHEWVPAQEIEEVNTFYKDREEFSDRSRRTTNRESYPPVSQRSSETEYQTPDREDFEERAEALKKTIIMHAPVNMPILTGSNTKARGKFSPQAFDEVNLVIHKKLNNNYASQVLQACLLLVLFVFIWHKGTFLNRVTHNNDIAAKPLIVQPAIPAEQTPLKGYSTPLTYPIQVNSKDPQLTRKGKKPKNPVVSPAYNKANKKAGIKEAEDYIPPSTMSSAEYNEPETPEPVVEPEVKEPPVTSAESKKTFGQAIKGLFKKRNKKIDTTIGR